MPLTEADQRRVDEFEAELAAAGPSKFAVRVPGDSQKLGVTTVVCLILNRTIGSGIYVSPALVLRATNSIGASLFLWTLGAFFGICGVLVWLEFGLNVPKFEPSKISPELCQDDKEEGPRKGVPRNGGEKNYLEFVYEHPQFRTTCMYGFVFVILGNLSGNAIAFGMYFMRAVGMPDHHNAAIRGLAVGVLTIACLLHGSWRKAGVVVNNLLAFIKVLTLITVIGIGFAAGAGASLGSGPVGKGAIRENFSVHASFDDARGNVADYSASILLIVYSFSGFKQPFYMLSEVLLPKKKFAMTTIGTMIFVGILFLLVNVAYFCAIKKEDIVNSEDDMAIIFFQELFGNETAPRVMAGMIALSLVGNIVVMTFTASRVKQEIAKEGVLPFSHFFAKSTVTPYARLKARLSPGNNKESLEESPAAALLLHWVFAVLLVAVTSSKTPTVAYTILVELYSYTLVVMVGFAVSTGIVLLHWCKFRGWKNTQKEWIETSDFSSWGSPAAAINYAIICAFLIVTLFLTPSQGSAFSESRTGVPPYVIPTVGLSTLLMGYIYYLVFAKLIPKWKNQVLIVDKEPIIVRQGGRPDGEWVQCMEAIDFWWAAKSPAATET